MKENIARLAELASEFRIARAEQAQRDAFYEAYAHASDCSVSINSRTAGFHDRNPVCSCALAERRRIVELEAKLAETEPEEKTQ